MSNENEAAAGAEGVGIGASRVFLPPTGGQVMGALVSALRLREHDPTKTPDLPGELSSDLSHTANYFRGASAVGGDRIEDEYRRRVSGAIADALLAGGLVPRWAQTPELTAVSHKDVLADALTHISGFTDGVRGMFVGQPLWLAQSDPIITWRPLIRFAAVELGVRAGAVFSMAGLERPMPATQFWATPEGAGWLLRHWMSDRGLGPITERTLLDLVAEAEGENDRLDRSTVSRWRRGKVRPSVRYAEAIAQALAKRTGRDGADLFRRLEWFDGLHEIARDVATEMGSKGDADMAWKIVEDAAALAVRVLRNTMEYLEKAPLTPVQREALGAVSLGRGTDQIAPYLVDLAKFLAGREHNEMDAVYVLRAFGDFDDLLKQLAALAQDLDWHEAELARRFRISPNEARSSLRKAVAHFQDELLAGRGMKLPMTGTVQTEDGPINTEGLKLGLQAEAAYARRDMRTCLELRRKAVELNPNDHIACFKLGALLGQLGMIDEAMTTLRHTVTLRPQWDWARAEIGIILVNCHRYAEAETEIRRHLAELGRPDAWLLSILGAALNGLERWEEACGVFEQSLDLRGDHPVTLMHAARANFKAGRKERGLALAKAAADLGERETYDQWEARVFGGRRRK